MEIIIISVLTALATALVLDGIWLKVWEERFYGEHIARLILKDPSIVSAGVFYLIYALGITMFVVDPGFQQGTSLINIFLFGALFGLIAYLMYNVTNDVDFKEQPVFHTFMDSLWGAFLGGATSVVAYTVVQYVLGM